LLGRIAQEHDQAVKVQRTRPLVQYNKIMHVKQCRPIFIGLAFLYQVVQHTKTCNFGR